MGKGWAITLGIVAVIAIAPWVIFLVRCLRYRLAQAVPDKALVEGRRELRDAAAAQQSIEYYLPRQHGWRFPACSEAYWFPPSMPRHVLSELVLLRCEPLPARLGRLPS